MGVLLSTVIPGESGADQSHEPVPGGLIQQQLISRPVRPRLNADAQRAPDCLFESCCRRDVVGVRGGALPAGLAAARDFGFELADRPIAVDCAVSPGSS